MALLLAPRALSFMATIIKSSWTLYSKKGAESNAPGMCGLWVCGVLQQW
jgi:hypothetical protein